ncbi:MAG: metallophosphoesterase [Planctomycetota bacterium]|nr:MAG: metallophosphoesterase [Planctomycetota bacterium]
MLRLLHTADWQLGLKAGQLGARAAELVREARLEVVERLAELAHARQLDAVLVAGDVFDDNAVGATVVRQAVHLLERFAPIPVYLLPGNHDALTPDTVYDRAEFTPGPHVHVLREAAPVPLAGGRGVLYPCPLRERWPGADPTAWIPPRAAAEAACWRVGLAHGAVDRLPESEQAPARIAQDRAARAGLDYLALGDWHGTCRVDERTWYAGTPEQTRMKEQGAGHALVVELEVPGQPPHVEQIRVARLGWYAVEAELYGAEDVAALERRLAAEVTQPRRALLELVLAGELAPQAHRALAELVRRWGELVLHLRVRGEARLRTSAAELDALAPAGLARAAAERLHLQAERGEGAEAERARRALALLLELAGEG